MRRKSKTSMTSMDRVFRKMDRDMAIGYGAIIIAVFFFVFLVGGPIRGIFVSKDVAIRALKAQGYSNIQIMDRAWLKVGAKGCRTNDAARFTAKATNPSGNHKEVFVCTNTLPLSDTEGTQMIIENQ